MKRSFLLLSILETVLVLSVISCGKANGKKQPAQTVTNPQPVAPSPVPSPSAAPQAAVDTRAEATIQSIQSVIVNNQCVRCHSTASNTNGNLNLTNIGNYIATQPTRSYYPNNNYPQNGTAYPQTNANGQRTLIVPGQPENSLFYQVLTNGRMPKDGPKVTQENIRIVETWIRGLNYNNTLQPGVPTSPTQFPNQGGKPGTVVVPGQPYPNQGSCGCDCCWD